MACFLLLAILPASLSAKPFASARATKPVPPVDAEYVLALAAANNFLHAWQTGDPEAGLLLVTDRLRQRTTENALVNFFSPGPSQWQSFEIGRGKKLAPGRYQFPVSLFQKSAAANCRWMRPETSVLIVVKAGKNDWAIDRLP